ncbi:MAG: hypothetical protein ACK5N8_05350 [Alphaproteobacteria bacterium]
MKKILVFGMSIAIALAFTVSSCGSKEEAPAPVVDKKPVTQEVQKPQLPKERGISVADFSKKATYYAPDKQFDKVSLQGKKIVFSGKVNKKEFSLPDGVVVLGSVRGPDGNASSMLVTVKVSGQTKWLIFYANPLQANKYRVWYTPGEDLFYWAKNTKPDVKELK